MCLGLLFNYLTYMRMLIAYKGGYSTFSFFSLLKKMKTDYAFSSARPRREKNSILITLVYTGFLIIRRAKDVSVDLITYQTLSKLTIVGFFSQCHACPICVFIAHP